MSDEPTIEDQGSRIVEPKDIDTRELERILRELKRRD
jgi:hypothetical protein